jgi:hypothetical protein
MFILVSLLSWISLFALPVHEFHTSLAQINYNKGTQSFEVSLRVFTDDLEAALTLENQHKKLTIDQDIADRIIQQYLEKHFALLNGQNKKKPMNYVGKEVEVDVTWIYVEIPANENPSGFRLQNSIFTELFDDQVNIVNLKYLDTATTLLYNANQTVQTTGIK